MLRLVTGSFSPDLETALIEDLRRCKAADPLAPLALIVPSSTLVTHLRRLLVVEAGLPLLNVHFLTFYQLALRLADERRSSGEPGTTAPPGDIVQDWFCEQLVGHILKRGLPDLAPLARAAAAPGAAAALWATVRDLADAAVIPDVALRALGEGLFEAEDRPMLRALFTLQAAVMETNRVLGVGTAEDLTASLLSWVPRSPFLAGLRQVYYYGFYDLTQVQLSFFEAVTERLEATVYFPRGAGPAFAFARRFVERHLSAVRPGPDRAAAPRPAGSVRLLTVVGVEDELATVCKAVLDLVETQGYRFDEIGLTARTLAPYQPSLCRIFDEHRIPFVTTAGGAAMQEPLVKAVLQLSRLPFSGFARAPVLDLLTSPFYRIPNEPGGAVMPRPEQWKWLAGEAGIMGGEEDWQRLASVPSEKKADAAAQAQLVWRLVSRLIKDCRQLPERGGMAQLTEAFRSLAEQHVNWSGDATEESVARDERVMPVVESVWAQLRQLDRLGLDVAWEEWARLFAGAMERAVLPEAGDRSQGVMVLDAMAARGLSFRALFVIGLNEKVFPRVVREDAFLRDRNRVVLAETLGYKIDEKLAGYDEEALLFALLRQAARERLYLVAQRADAEGRPLAPSPFVQEGLGDERPNSQLQPAVLVPRRLAAKVGVAPFLPSLLTRREWALYRADEGYDITAFLAAIGRDEDLFRNGLASLRSIEGDEAGPHDGFVGQVDGHWSRLTTKGIAPTPLEQYARCPFQYFAAQVLGLKSIRPVPSGVPSARILGDLYHATLHLLYGRLRESGWPAGRPDADGAGKLVRSVADEAFAAYEAGRGSGYVLLWELAKETVVELVTDLLAQDREDCLAGGFRPVAFEVEAEGSLDDLDSQLGPVRIRGRLDRVDERQAPPGWRIVDYKFKQSRDMVGEDRDQLTAAIRGRRVQPALYARLSGPEALSEAARSLAPERVELLFLAPGWERRIERSPFEASAWQGPAGQPLSQMVARLLHGIKAGRYFILPDGYCETCDYAAACRRFHGPTWWRAYRSAPARELRQLRKQKVEKP